MSRVFLFRFLHLLIPSIHCRIHIEHFEFSFHICCLTHAKNNFPAILENGIDCLVNENCNGVRWITGICCSSSCGTTTVISHKILCKVTGTTIVLLVVIIAIVVVVFGAGVSMGRGWCRCFLVMMSFVFVILVELLLLVEKMVACVVVLYLCFFLLYRICLSWRKNGFICDGQIVLIRKCVEHRKREENVRRKKDKI